LTLGAKRVGHGYCCGEFAVGHHSELVSVCFRCGTFYDNRSWKPCEPLMGANAPPLFGMPEESKAPRCCDRPMLLDPMRPRAVCSECGRRIDTVPGLPAESNSSGREPADAGGSRFESAPREQPRSFFHND
jgi:hypothetical protein